MDVGTHTRSYLRHDSVVFRMTTGEFGALSNMAPDFPLAINGARILTTEALYQACRFPNFPEIQAVIIDQPSPMTAKMKSKRYRENTRADWEKYRVRIMRWCLRVKLAQNWARFGAVLLQTGALSIVEESRKDDFWGAKRLDEGTLVGMNVLGRLLMELRASLMSPEKERLRFVEQPEIPEFLFLGKAVGLVGAVGDTQSALIQTTMFAR